MGFKRALIHMLGGYTKHEYDDMSRIATDAMKSWQNTIDLNNKEIEILKQNVERYIQAYESTSNKYIKILNFISVTFGDKNKSRDDILKACKSMLNEIDNEDL